MRKTRNHHSSPNRKIFRNDLPGNKYLILAIAVKSDISKQNGATLWQCPSYAVSNGTNAQKRNHLCDVAIRFLQGNQTKRDVMMKKTKLLSQLIVLFTLSLSYCNGKISNRRLCADEACASKWWRMVEFRGASIKVKVRIHWKWAMHLVFHNSYVSIILVFTIIIFLNENNLMKHFD